MRGKQTGVTHSKTFLTKRVVENIPLHCEAGMWLFAIRAAVSDSESVRQGKGRPNRPDGL